MEISVLQWNIWYEEDIRHIGEFLLANKADVICLQELTVDKPGQAVANTPEYIAQQLGYHHFAKELPIESTDGQAMMLANGIFSRFPINSSRFVWTNQPGSGGGYADEYRAYVEVELDVEGAPLTVGTTHMSYTHRFEPSPQKQRETDALVVELSKNQQNFVFTGDLNSPPGSPTIESIAAILQAAGPNYAEKTWTTKPFMYNEFEETDLDWRLDYVFTTPDITVESSAILTTDYSDHLPILTTVNLD